MGSQEEGVSGWSPAGQDSHSSLLLVDGHGSSLASPVVLLELVFTHCKCGLPARLGLKLEPWWVPQAGLVALHLLQGLEIPIIRACDRLWQGACLVPGVETKS